jgi:hypothetical protein
VTTDGTFAAICYHKVAKTWKKNLKSGTKKLEAATHYQRFFYNNKNK